MKRRHVGDPAHFGEAARPAQVRLGNIDATRFKRLLETETPVPGFAARDRPGFAAPGEDGDGGVSSNPVASRLIDQARQSILRR